MSKKPIPGFIDIRKFDHFVEKDTEVDKETLIRRCAGAVDLSMLTILKLLVFFRVGKDGRGQMYMV